MIDLSTLKEGDICVLRCGGRLSVERTKTVDFITQIDDLAWFNNGNYTGKDSPFDIISIERAQEPRKVVEYFSFSWIGGIMGILETLDNSKRLHPNADKYFKITVIEGQSATIEEVK